MIVNSLCLSPVGSRSGFRHVRNALQHLADLLVWCLSDLVEVRTVWLDALDDRNSTVCLSVFRFTT